MTLNTSTITSVFRKLDREIWIVTSAAEKRRGGLTATWVTPSSIDDEHPVVQVGLAPQHFTAELVDSSGAFALHLLKTTQVETALHFATGSGRDRDKLAGVTTALGVSGSPLLKHCLAWLDCRVFARLTTGDRTHYWADVVDAMQVADGEPLREQRFISQLNDAQRRELLADRQRDADLQRSRQQAWRTAIPEWLRRK